MLDNLRTMVNGVNDVQTRMLEVSGTAWSADRMVKATVGPRGQLTHLEIDPRVYRKPNSVALAETIVATVHAAAEQALRRSQEIMDAYVPRDLRVGELDLRQLGRTQDADLRTKETDRGQPH
jgi:DNA-binding protein YbaB